jgi:hypothetical protein
MLIEGFWLPDAIVSHVGDEDVMAINHRLH